MPVVNSAALLKRRQVPVKKSCGHGPRSAAPLGRCPRCPRCRKPLAAPLGVVILNVGPL